MTMFTTIMVLSILAADAQPYKPGADWTIANTAVEAVFVVAQVIDMGQTNYAMRNIKGAYECNPVFGKHPSRLRIESQMIGGIVFHMATSYFLPPRWREVWQTVALMEIGVVISNGITMGGLKVQF